MQPQLSSMSVLEWMVSPLLVVLPRMVLPRAMEEEEWRMTIDDERKKEDRRGNVDLYMMVGVVVGAIEPTLFQCDQFQTINRGLFTLSSLFF